MNKMKISSNTILMKCFGSLYKEESTSYVRQIDDDEIQDEEKEEIVHRQFFRFAEEKRISLLYSIEPHLINSRSTWFARNGDQRSLVLTRMSNRNDN